VSEPSNGIALLYVDDDLTLLELGKTFLENGGIFEVDIAQSGGEALDILQRKEYEGIISDYLMPEMDGIRLLERVRVRYPDLPFILFTGKGREEVVIQAFDAGADYYVQKGGDIRSQFRELSHKIQLAVKKRDTEKALRASEERYRNIIEDQTEFICRFRSDGTHNFVNDAYCRYFGLEREEILGHRFQPEIPAEDKKRIKTFFSSLTPDHPVDIIEHRIIMQDGDIRWQRWSDRAIFDPSGKISEYQSVGRDVTDKKEAELDLGRKNEELQAAYEQLTATEEELRTSYDDLAESQRTLEHKDLTLNAIIEESPIPQFVIDRNHTILYWNHALAVYSGIAADEMVGTDHHWKAFYPARRPCMADLLIDGSRDRIPEWYPDNYARSSLIEDAFEATDFFPRMGKDGVWLHFTAGLIKNRNGDIIGAVESLEDITDEKNAELDLSRKNEELQAAYEQLTATEEELRASYDDLAESQRTLEYKDLTLNAIIEESPVPQFVIDRNHTILYWNHALAVYSGIAADEMVGTDHHWKAFYLAPRPCMADLLIDGKLDTITEWYPDKYARSSLIEDAFEVTDFFPRMGKNGVWLHFTAGLIKNRNGDSIGAVESLEDVTDEKNAELDLIKTNEEIQAAYSQLAATEEELRTNFDDLVTSQQALKESEMRYRNVVEDQTELICRFRPDGTHVFVNDAYCRYFNKRREEIIGHHFQPRLFAEDVKKVRTVLLSLTPDKPVGFIRQRVIFPDGSVRWQRWIDRAIYDNGGKLVEYQSVGRDITDIKDAEQALEQSEQRYRNVVEDQTELISRFLPDGTHVFVNEAYCRYFNKKREDIIGEKFMPSMPAEDRVQVSRHLASLTKEHPVATITQRIIMPDGRIRWQEWSDRAIFDTEGRVTEYQSVGRDIPETKRTTGDPSGRKKMPRSGQGKKSP
jgi:PAS domain S-box-containing protein